MINRIMIARLSAWIAISVCSTSSYSSNSLDVEFSGELLSTACQVTTETVKQNITLYNLRWKTINEQGSSAITPFNIKVHRCSTTDIGKSIKLTWQSPQLVTVGSEQYLSTTGSSGVLLGLVDKEKKPIVWNKAVQIGSVTEVEGEQSFDFGVFVRKPESGEVKAGDFTGTVTFNVEYE